MEQKDYFIKHARLHPSVRPQDMIKLCYQAAYGAEHLLEDLTAAKEYLDKEFSNLSSGSSLLYEYISPSFCRVNLYAWKVHGLPSERLFQMFADSVSIPPNGKTEFSDLLKEVRKLSSAGVMPFSLDEWNRDVEAYLQAGGGPVHHSNEYRAAEQPAYRLVHTSFVSDIESLSKLKEEFI